MASLCTMQCNDDRNLLAHPNPPIKDNSASRVKRESRPGAVQHPLSSTRRTVCDHCRRRRIRCDGQFPCQQCVNATLQCKREHVPKKRGPKRGHGRVINELRAREEASREPSSGNSSDIDTDHLSSTHISATATAPPYPQPYFVPWMNSSSTFDSCHVSEPSSPFTSDTFHPNSRSYLHLLPQCVGLYYEHIYPIMPLLYMPNLRATMAQPLEPRDKNLLYALCALTSFHMSGKSLSAQGPPSWETVGRFFLDECISVRQRYDFIEELSLSAVISSFWLSTSFFEISQSRKSWYYLREALTLALDLGLHDDASYVGLDQEEVLCRQRVFWILFVTERSFAILRNKPLTLRKTPSLPSTGHKYEVPEIHTGFMKLVESYVPLDESFVNAWNDGSDSRVSTSTYLNLQRILAKPPDLISRPRRQNQLGLINQLDPCKRDIGKSIEVSEPTAIQKADLLMTQQWLRLIVWQSSFRQGLLSTAASDESMTFAFPLCIARDTASILQSLPSSAIEVHGMGIFEKIFEVGTWCVNVLGAYESRSSSLGRLFSGAFHGMAGMDFVGGEMGLLYQGGRGGAKTDPIEFFVKILSLSPNSRTMFAEKLLMFAGETPGGMRTALSPALSSSSATETKWVGCGAVIGEVTDQRDVDEVIGALDLDNVQSTRDTHMADGIHSTTALGNPLLRQGTKMNIGDGIGRKPATNDSTPNDPDSTSFSVFSDTDWGNHELGNGALAVANSRNTGSSSGTVERSASLGTFMGGDTGVMTRNDYTDGKEVNSHQKNMAIRFPTSGIIGV